MSTLRNSGIAKPRLAFLLGLTLPVCAFLQIAGNFVPVQQSQAAAIGSLKLDLGLIWYTIQTNPPLGFRLVYVWFLLFAVLCFVAPVLEELVFRKGLMRLLGVGSFGLVASSLLFAAAHLNFWVFPHLFLAGLWFGYVYRQAGYWASVGCHALFNFIAVSCLVLT
jgi:membrane protease YdiL (CAAX protease family)